MNSRQIGSEKVMEAFGKTFGGSPSVLVRAPGRLNLLGSHVDHQEGWVLPGAIDRSVWLAARPIKERRLRLHALDLGLEDVVDLDDLAPPRGRRSLRWSDYPAGVAWSLEKRACSLPGLEAVYGGDLPREVGVSSSAAVEVAFLLAWQYLEGIEAPRVDLALIGRQVENEYLGIGSGVMDQFASLLGRRGHLIEIDCRTLEYETIPFPEELRLLVVDSGIRRQLGRSGYNDALDDCAKATRALREGGWPIETLRDLSPGDLERVLDQLEGSQAERAEHVVRECARVLQGAELLARGELEAFGRLLDRSHASSRDLWHVSTKELDLLADTASSSPGCLGARLSGAGLGGCVLALTDRDGLDSTRRAVEQAFESRFGRIPDSFTCRISAGAEVMPCV